jgi:hypothetical protein
MASGALSAWVRPLKPGEPVVQQAVDVGVDVHHEHRAVLAWKHVQVIEEQLAGLRG